MFKRGFSLIELILVVGITVIIATITFNGFFKNRQERDLQDTAKQIASILREAQSRSVVQSMNTNWSVFFGNPASSRAYYALRAMVTSTVTEFGRYVLPPTIAYNTTNLPLGASSSIVFGSVSGKVIFASTTNIGLYLISNPSHAVTITVATSGSVSF